MGTYNPNDQGHYREGDRRLKAQLSLNTRDVNKPTRQINNISIDFNASRSGTARGTEVIIPDNASPELRAAAEQFNEGVVAFAKKHGIVQPNRGVKTRSQNGRGVSNTVHAEPFFNTNVELQKIIKDNIDEFSQVYADSFGALEGVRIIPPHGVGNDRGASSSVFGSETEFGKQVVSSLMKKPYYRPAPRNRLDNGGDQTINNEIVNADRTFGNDLLSQFKHNSKSSKSDEVKKSGYDFSAVFGEIVLDQHNEIMQQLADAGKVEIPELDLGDDNG